MGVDSRFSILLNRRPFADDAASRKRISPFLLQRFTNGVSSASVKAAGKWESRFRQTIG